MAKDPTENREIERKLHEYCETREKALRNELHGHYCYIAEIMARRFSGRGIEYADLYQVASLALLKALERFDINRGVKLQSFAVPTIVGEIKNYFRNTSHSIKVPRRSNENIKRIKVVVNELTLKLMRSPKASEIAEAMELSEETVLELLETAQNMRPASLDASENDESENDITYRIGLEEKGYNHVENKEFIKTAIGTLNEKEKFIIIERFYKQKSQREVAKSIGVSQMYISRTEKKILDKMRKMLG